jgi:hypothetical protein
VKELQVWKLATLHLKYLASLVCMWAYNFP